MNLYKWEMKQMFRTKVFWFIGGAFVFLMYLLHSEDLIKGGVGGYELFLNLCRDFRSASLFFTGIFAGLHITGAFDDRRMQAAVMAGNSRAKVLLTKFASFASAIALYFATSVLLPATIGFIRFGTVCEDGSFLRNVVARAPLYLLTEIAVCSICFIISMLCKKPGIAVIVNMVTTLTASLAVQFIALKPWGENVLRYLPHGQNAIVFSDMSNKNCVLALGVCIAFIAIVIMGSYAKFRKEELK